MAPKRVTHSVRCIVGGIRRGGRAAGESQGRRSGSPVDPTTEVESLREQNRRIAETFEALCTKDYEQTARISELLERNCQLEVALSMATSAQDKTLSMIKPENRFLDSARKAEHARRDFNKTPREKRTLKRERNYGRERSLELQAELAAMEARLSSILSDLAGSDAESSIGKTSGEKLQETTEITAMSEVSKLPPAVDAASNEDVREQLALETMAVDMLYAEVNEARKKQRTAEATAYSASFERDELVKKIAQYRAANDKLKTQLIDELLKYETHMTSAGQANDKLTQRLSELEASNRALKKQLAKGTDTELLRLN